MTTQTISRDQIKQTIEEFIHRRYIANDKDATLSDLMVGIHSDKVQQKLCVSAALRETKPETLPNQI